MDTKEKEILQRYIILIPHRDALNLLNEYRQKLFSLGFLGAHSFPAAAALAAVSRPFDREKLKELARKIRSLTMENDGKILAAETALVNCNHAGDLSITGPRLNITIDESLFPESSKGKVLYTISPVVLCGALVESENFIKISRKVAKTQSPGDTVETVLLSQAPVLSFRAAAVANLAIQGLAGSPASQEPNYSFEWEIGRPVWLPAYRGK